VNLSKTRVVIIGAGQAGGRAAEALRAAGHTGPISLIGEEAHLPYERPQLSKAILLDGEPNPVFIRSANDWAELDVTLSTFSRVVAADLERREIGLEDGRKFAFDQLLLATGTRPRRMPELEAGPLPVSYLRCMDDALALRNALQPGKKVVLIGGGVIGLEVASAAIARGCHVTVLEKAATVLPQIGSPTLSRYAETLHAAKGVDIQIVGHPGGGDEIVRGDVANGRFTTLSVRDNEVVGGIAVNSAREMSVLRRLVASRKTVRNSDLENPEFELKRTLAS
jgi:p-cumate 2,3-dioxygenase ferredoxin reductase component